MSSTCADIAFRTTGTLIGDGLIKRKLVKASEALFGTSLEDLPEQEAQALLAEAEAAKAEEAADAETNADEVAAEETDVAAESDADTTDDVAVSSEEFDAAQDETDAKVKASAVLNPVQQRRVGETGYLGDVLYLVLGIGILSGIERQINAQSLSL